MGGLLQGDLDTRGLVRTPGLETTAGTTSAGAARTPAEQGLEEIGKAGLASAEPWSGPTGTGSRTAETTGEDVLPARRRTEVLTRLPVGAQVS